MILKYALGCILGYYLEESTENCNIATSATSGIPE